MPFEGKAAAYFFHNFENCAGATAAARRAPSRRGDPGITMSKARSVSVAFILFLFQTVVVEADGFKVPGFEVQEDVLIEELREDEDWIDITYWRQEKDGFILLKQLGSRLSSAREEPRVSKSSAGERQRIVDAWKRRGHSAQVTYADGSASEVESLH